MLRLLMIAREADAQAEFRRQLARNGLACSIASYLNGVKEALAEQHPDILLVEMNGQSPDATTLELIKGSNEEKRRPVVALVPSDMLERIKDRLDFADDFLTAPYDACELALRVVRLLHRAGNPDSDNSIICEGLVIDPTTCEVAVDGKVVELTFKEYELLKLLAGHRGRVYTREALLNSIWGYDYFGGDRTVDVHVRRLRSKIEDSKHNFIETVRNIGYRFKKEM